MLVYGAMGAGHIGIPARCVDPSHPSPACPRSPLHALQLALALQMSLAEAQQPPKEGEEKKE